MSVADTIRAKLTAAFTPQRLDVYDDSDRHHGHTGAREGGETHFRVMIVSDAFDRLSRVDRHRRVNETLAQELNDRVHALSLTVLTPDEAARRM